MVYYTCRAASMSWELGCLYIFNPHVFIDFQTILASCNGSTNNLGQRLRTSYSMKLVTNLISYQLAIKIPCKSVINNCTYFHWILEWSNETHSTKFWFINRIQSMFLCAKYSTIYSIVLPDLSLAYLYLLILLLEYFFFTFSHAIEWAAPTPRYTIVCWAGTGSCIKSLTIWKNLFL